METMKILIGLSGKARSGKDSVGEFLVEELSAYGVVKAAFADELKRQVAEHFDLSHEQLYGDLKEVPDERYKKPGPPQGVAVTYDDGRGLPPWYWTPREIMQEYGQFMRTIDYDYWIKVLFRKLTRQEQEVVVITDVRHINEVNAVLDIGGVHIRIYRDSDEVNAVHNQQHISETALDNYGHINYEVNNNGTLDDLRITARNLARIIKEKYKEELHDG